MKHPISETSPRYRVEDIPDFDFARHLDSEEMIAAYLDAVLEDNDMELLVAALGHVARARGMTQVAEDSGISREALYRALKKDKKPRFETVSKVCTALGLRLTVQPLQAARV